MDYRNLEYIPREEFEYLLLTQLACKEDYRIPQHVVDILEGRYKNVIDDEVLSNYMKSSNGNDFLQMVHDGIENEVISFDTWLCVGIASLMQFIQYNWTGPQNDDCVEWLKTQEGVALQHLSLHDECNSNVKKPELLYFSKTIFSNKSISECYNSCHWWLFRASYIHQLVLNEASAVIFNEIEQLIEKIEDSYLLEDEYCNTSFYTEAIQFYFFYRRIKESKKYVEFAQKVTKLDLNLEGVLGKRTKHQQEEKAQLYLKIDTRKSPFPFRTCENLPKSLDLNDDVRLEKIDYSKNIEHPEIGAMEEAVILAKFCHSRRIT